MNNNYTVSLLVFTFIFLKQLLTRPIFVREKQGNFIYEQRDGDLRRATHIINIPLITRCAKKDFLLNGRNK